MAEPANKDKKAKKAPKVSPACVNARNLNKGKWLIAKTVRMREKPGITYLKEKYCLSDINHQ